MPRTRMPAHAERSDPVRLEHDLLGEYAVPSCARYGVHTARARANFRITGDTLARYPQLIEALASGKKAAAVANERCGRLDAATAAAIIGACEQLRRGELHDEFVVDPLQGGAGTSTKHERERGDRQPRPRATRAGPRGVRRGAPARARRSGQSANDVYPTAITLALHRAAGELLESLRTLREALEAKAEEFARSIKLGRTQLQDAVPMTLGQEFSAFAGTPAKDE